MNELTLTELDMGVAVPKILQAFKPYVDHQGNSSLAGKDLTQGWKNASLAVVFTPRLVLGKKPSPSLPVRVDGGFCSYSLFSF